MNDHYYTVLYSTHKSRARTSPSQIREYIPGERLSMHCWVRARDPRADSFSRCVVVVWSKRQNLSAAAIVHDVVDEAELKIREEVK